MRGGEVERADELLRLALADPVRAEVLADTLLRASTEPWTLSAVHQARGVMLRDRGRTADAVVELRAARELALRTADPDRLADVRATLGITLVLHGRSRIGLLELDRAVTGARDRQVRARCLMRRGTMLSMVLGRNQEALADLRAALRVVHALGDRIWEARTLSNLSLLYLDVGDLAGAERALDEARLILETEGQHLEAVAAVHNQGSLAFYRGDLPGALRFYDEAAVGYEAWGESPLELGQDQCQALLAAGLPDEVCMLVAALLDDDHVPAAHRAQLQLYLAYAELARGDAGSASVAARAARDRFRRQGRDVAAMRAELVLISARRRTGAKGAALADAAEGLAGTLDGARSEDAPLAWLVAGRAATELGRDATPLWSAAARYRRHPSGLVRATAWLAQALDREGRDDLRGVWHACRRGLDALDDHRATLGSTELRSLASVQGDELAGLALSHAVRARPRTQLWWSERWRATTLTAPLTRPPDDRELAGLLAALRANDRRLGEARDEGEAVGVLERERARLEKAIQHRRRLVGGSADAERLRAGLDVDRLVDEVADATFVELFQVGGRLRSVVVTGRRVRAFDVGSAGDAAAAVDSARFVLRQAARGRPVRLAGLGTRLQKALLGPSVRALGRGPVVVSPTASLHSTPWGLLPALAGVPLTVVPTASAWLRARGTLEPGRQRQRRVLIAGPGLASGGAEVPLVAGRHPDAVVLHGGAATVDASLRAMDGAGLVHVAAHGRFRADNPMFSALELHDGPMTVHDLEGLARAPHRFVLSSCDSGVLAPVGANELLGLASALMSMGTAGILSSVAPVNDEATVELMVDVHAGLDEHDDLGAVMRDVRERARGDLVREATAAAFVALGV